MREGVGTSGVAWSGREDDASRHLTDGVTIGGRRSGLWSGLVK